MNRRGFLGAFAAGIAGIALKEAIPFNRVWSFPSKIRIPTLHEQYTSGVLGKSLGFEWYEDLELAPIPVGHAGQFEIGDIVTINDWPETFVVSRVHPEKVDLYAQSQRLVRRNVDAAKLTAFSLSAPPQFPR